MKVKYFYFALKLNNILYNFYKFLYLYYLLQ